MEKMTPELGVKVAACFRHFRSMKSELATAQDKLASADKEKANLQQDLEAYRALFDGVMDGTIDPDDCEEKLAEMKDHQAVKTAAEKAASVTNDSSVSLGQVDDDTIAGAGDMDPLTAHLLGANAE